MSDRSARRWAVSTGFVAAILLLGYLLVAHGPHASFWPKCLFHKLTGLHCAGCGMTRAVHATLQGDLVAAFRYNPVVMGLLLFGMLGVIWELLARFTGKSLPFRPRPGWRWLWAVLGLLLLFWVLRNIPLWPFTLLAPP